VFGQSTREGPYRDLGSPVNLGAGCDPLKDSEALCPLVGKKNTRAKAIFDARD